MLAVILKTQFGYGQKPIMTIEDSFDKGDWVLSNFQWQNSDFEKKLHCELDCFVSKRLIVLRDSGYDDFLGLYYCDSHKRDSIVASLNIPYIAGDRFPNACWDRGLSTVPGYYAFIPMSAINCAKSWWQAEAYLSSQSPLNSSIEASEQRKTIVRYLDRWLSL